jgi:hypothetical protein
VAAHSNCGTPLPVCFAQNLRNKDFRSGPRVAEMPG